MQNIFLSPHFLVKQETERGKNYKIMIEKHQFDIIIFSLYIEYNLQRRL